MSGRLAVASVRASDIGGQTMTALTDR